MGGERVGLTTDFVELSVTARQQTLPVFSPLHPAAGGNVALSLPPSESDFSKPCPCIIHNAADSVHSFFILFFFSSN